MRPSVSVNVPNSAHDTDNPWVVLSRTADHGNPRIEVRITGDGGKTVEVNADELLAAVKACLELR